jgi:poly(3-hydroxyalkanoate) depolymerase
MVVSSTARSDDALVEVRGRRLRVAVRRSRASASTGPPLLLINGIGAPLELLDPFVAALPVDREVVRFDPPGIGGSPDAALPYHLTTFTPVIGDLVRVLGHDRVDVLGYSWGGQLAQQLAVTRPALVRRLVLVATATGVLSVPASPRVLSRFLHPRFPKDPAEAVRVAAALYGGTVRSHPERAAAVLALIGASLRTHRRGYNQQLTAAAGWTSLPLLRMVRARTLVVAGDDDPIIPWANARLLAAGIPGAHLYRHPGGHLAIATEAAELAGVVERFLAQPESRSPWRTPHSPPGGSDS